MTAWVGSSADSPGRFSGLVLRAAALIRHGFAVPPSPLGEGFRVRTKGEGLGAFLLYHYSSTPEWGCCFLLLT